MTKLVALLAPILICSACSTTPFRDDAKSLMASRQPAQASASTVALVPQESYGEVILQALNQVDESTLEVNVMQYNFFTDNKGDTYPKRIAAKLIALKNQYPKLPIRVALESKDGLSDPQGKGAAQRNAKTKAVLLKAGIQVLDVYGLAIKDQKTPGSRDGISHIKSVQIGEKLIDGSTNLTQQSTTPGSNNEMNVVVQSTALSQTLSAYFKSVAQNPGQMVNVTAQDGSVRLLTDQLIFDEFLAQIKKAQTGDSLSLAMYEFLYRSAADVEAKALLDELLNAHRRGVDVKVFLNRAQDLQMQNSLVNLSVAETLTADGIKVYFDPESKISHSKYLVRSGPTERAALISSANFYGGDFNNNHQAAWALTDARLVDQLSMYFAQQVAYDGTLLTLIPVDPKTGLRYQKRDGQTPPTKWNDPKMPTRMLRFWRGFRQDSVSPEVFRANVNKVLIPATTDVAAGRGLNAYLPSFLPDEKPGFLPDEIAIIDYLSEESYNGIRTTEPGRSYGPLHFSPGLFTKQNKIGETSASVVAIPYAGTVNLNPTGSAYMIGSPDLDWQKGSSARRILLPTKPLTPELVQNYIDSLNRNLQSLGLNGAAILIDPRYLIVMLNTNNPSADLDAPLEKLEENSFSKFDFKTLRSQPAGATRLDAGEGISVIFDKELLPPAIIRKVVLDEISKSSMQISQDQAPKNHLLNDTPILNKSRRAITNDCKSLFGAH